MKATVPTTDHRLVMRLLAEASHAHGVSDWDALHSRHDAARRARDQFMASLRDANWTHSQIGRAAGGAAYSEVFDGIARHRRRQGSTR